MADKTLDTRLKLKYDTAANWEAENPVLLAGEVGIESDTLLGKVGDGSKAWQQLEYFAPKCKEVTHAELKALRDINGLVPGMFYRITDYNCTTSQENTRSAGHAFDIIVKALSNNTLSENASATQHEGGGGSGDGSPQFKPEVLADSEGTLVDGAVVPSYYIFEDMYEMNGVKENYKSRDTFIAYTYMENNVGVVVPVIYKTDADGAINAPADFDYPDTEDTFFYDGTMEVDGVVYDKWRKITLTVDSELTWDSDGKVWALTNVVVTTDGNASDPYFENCKLNAWEVKYCLDNDKTRFWWASDTGTGVIYYMKDEYGNECPYDFKNIQFTRTTDSSVPVDGNYFTFSWLDENSAIKDLSILGNTTLLSDDGQIIGCYGNIMGACRSYPSGFYSDDPSNLCVVLPNNVFVSDYNYDGGMFYGCSNNIFGDSCNNNTFGDNCASNIFGDSCSYNIFGNDCNYNIFRGTCRNNTFGDNCASNTFGNDCQNNTFGDNCYNSTFGDNCSYNTFGDNCNNNTIDSGVSRAQPQATGTGYMQGIHIHYGVTGTFTVTRGASYQQDIRKSGSQEILLD